LPGTLERIEQRLSWRVVAGALGLAIGFGGTQFALTSQTPSSSLTAEHEPGQDQQLVGTTSGSKAEEIYFRNCDAVWAAGAAPIRRGDPGYGGHLDRDGDGVGCE
jgi:hypothetical protein